MWARGAAFVGSWFGGYSVVGERALRADTGGGSV